MAIHISELAIDTYRGIKNLELKGLSDINIITGDNNCGKTSVLEVVRSLSAPHNWLDWIKKRDSGLNYYDAVEYLFSANEADKRISYKVRMGESNKEIDFEIKAKKIRLSLAKSEIREIKRQSGILNHSQMQEKIENDIPEDVEMYKIDFFKNGRVERNTELYDFQTSFRYPDLDRSLQMIRTIYISPVQHTNGELFLSKVLDNPILYQEILEILGEFDENILSINADKTSNSRSSQTVYKILAKNQKSALPLNVYGDGMKKAVLLMSAVVLSKGGILLLDEFETAIHTSAMDRVFHWILKTCKKLDIQLFLTSHSQEAINKVLKCSPALQSSMRLITLYKKEDKTVARVLSGTEAIESQDELGLELR